ncbi:MAG: leucine-rich repeat-containing protein kinase family protein [Hydrogenophaga sp.]|uniref:leucine-rich repeat-containing protein kinase family protein n=1 Tax=Hydrogenophaga sp. TaxID=1904254 RepID=UPI00271FD4B5|nr:leucine-rich repeat-containing protein kinase family protein [Hydrogenophaga sp.]MDO9147633.1 leucine-rich repeat-containing protein kinase family protein [Hydrogenophaga sp.]MDO9606382.1 leucine-rich repeat-containing protein kinase family protein [Hydrogenophaga sp.]
MPPDLGRLHRLKIIFCSDNDFTHLPEALGDCPALEMVGFKANRIVDVPAHALPAALRWLVLTDNAITQLPSALGERPALQKLMLAGNQLNRLPPSLAGAQRLELMRLAANQLTQVPGWLPGLPRLAWLALAGNPLGWNLPPLPPLPSVPWHQLQFGERLGEGASGHIHRVRRLGVAHGEAQALKLFKGAVTSDGLPEHERAASLAAGQHPALCTPGAELCEHPQGLHGLLLPLIAPTHTNLAGPPSLDSCTRDVYPSGLGLGVPVALRLAQRMAQAVAHLHRRGVLHGDLYAHNMLWNPANGDAVLGDFGAATRLPADQPALSQALQALEVRALGCLLEELADHALAPLCSPTVAGLSRLAQACQHPQPRQRPTAAEVCHSLLALA